MEMKQKDLIHIRVPRNILKFQAPLQYFTLLSMINRDLKEDLIKKFLHLNHFL